MRNKDVIAESCFLLTLILILINFELSTYFAGVLDFDLAFGDDSTQPFYESDDDLAGADGM